MPGPDEQDEWYDAGRPPAASRRDHPAGPPTPRTPPADPRARSGQRRRSDQPRQAAPPPRTSPGPGPDGMPTTELPRGTGGQQPPRTRPPPPRPPRPAAPSPTEQVGRRPVAPSPSPESAPSPARPEPRGTHLPPYSEPDLGADGQPRKLTVTRIAAQRSKELTHRGVQLFRRATTADGAEQSGLTHLTYAVMANYAVDAALAVALANTLFFAAAAAESTGKVLLYLLITVAPFAVIAPFIGPLLDRIQNGRRIALAATSFGRALLAVVMAFNFDSWILYPCALLMMVLSKSFGVLKAALTPRVLPEQSTLVKTNSRLTVFGLIAGGVAGGVAAGFAGLTNSPGALLWTAVCGIAGGVLCLKIPAWVESTEGEVPVQNSEVLQRGRQRMFPPSVSATLWANVANRIETGFLALFIAFVVKTEYAEVSGFNQLLLLGIVGAAAGAGGFLGNGLGAKLPLTRPELVSAGAVACVALTTFVAILVPGLAMGAVVGLVGSTASSLAKVCLDSAIQAELPEASRASAFGLSESALQLAWVFGGVVGLLLGGVLHLSGDPVYMVGFAVVTVLVGVGLAQSWLARSGRALLPGLAASWEKRRTAKYLKSTGVTTAQPPPVTQGPPDPASPTVPPSTLPMDGSPGGAVDGTRPRRGPRKAGERR